MFRALFILLTAILLSGPAVVQAQQKQVLIRVVQDNASILYDFQTDLLLQRKPFKFQILLKNVEGVYVFASIGDSIYRFTENSVIQDFPYLKLLELRDEDIYNNNKELNISETGWSYWFYRPEPALHAYNRKVIPLDSGRIICTKAIKQLFLINESKTIKLRDVKTPLYLFFVAVSEFDADGKPSKELLRRKIRIDWIDEM
ncbi:MAG TPA: hypothetical protein VMZ03_09175 [Chitinophagaceae bacterium]|nr:hypothetical protein [Chitinophagaceae bacterium]